VYRLGRLGALDGLVGAVCGEMVITCPNADYIPEPPMGTRQVTLREDLRYGMDDATLWPQPYSIPFSHLAAIPRRPRANDRLNWMWYSPKPTDFVEMGGTVVSGIGMLDGMVVRALAWFVEDLRGSVEAYTSGTSRPFEQIVKAKAVMIHSWERLRNMPGTFEEKALELAEFQRAWLECRGALDYGTVYYPRTCINVGYDGKVKDIMGCFTEKAQVVQECFSAGIPVWFVRSWDSLARDTRVDREVPILKAEECLMLKRRSGFEYPVIYNGPANSDEYFKSQLRYTRSRMMWGDPWSSSLPELRTRASASSADSTYVRGKARPYPGKKVNDNRDKFVDVLHRLSPPAIPHWQTAQGHAKESVSGLIGLVADRTHYDEYCLPEPGLFLATSTIRRSSTYFRNWLRFRLAWQWRLSRAGHGPCKMSNTIWRECLFHGFIVKSHEPGTQSGRKAGGLSERRDRRMTEALGGTVRADGTVTVESHKFPVSGTVALLEGENHTRWQGEKVEFGPEELPDDKVVREVLWELHEWNFRLDLVALDHKLFRRKGEVDALERQRQISCCFVGGDSPGFSVSRAPAIPTRDEGLACRDLREAWPYLKALADVLRDWEVEVDPRVRGLMEATEVNERDIGYMAEGLAKIYCRAAYEHCGRPAVTPHRLE